MEKIEVLNGGYVGLVDSMGSDISVIRSARVSYNADWRAPENGEVIGKDEKLIKYLLSNKHTSPFESVTFTFEVKAPIFVFRQWHRHRTWSFNEISARYTELDMGYYVPELKHITGQSTSNKQMRTDEMHPEADLMQKEIDMSCKNAFRNYKRLLDKGVPRELARGVLPVNAYSKMFATIDLHNLMHFFNLRSHSHAQYEIRVYSDAMMELIKPIVPVTMKIYWELKQ